MQLAEEQFTVIETHFPKQCSNMTIDIRMAIHAALLVM